MVGVTVDQQATNSRSQLFYVGVWLLVTAMLVVALQTVSAPQALGDDGALDAADPASDFPLSGADPSTEADPSAVYSGMLWSVTDARVEHAVGLLERATVEVDVTLHNTLDNAQLRVPDSMVTLVSTDGHVVTEGRFVDAGARLALEPGESRSVTIDFEVGYTQRPTLGSLSLQIAEPNRVPASIALGSPQPENDLPIFAAVDTTPATVVDPDNAARQIVIEPAAASVDINAGPYRAALGEQLAVVKLQVQRAEANEAAGFLDTDYWALSVGDETVNAILVAGTPDLGSSTDEVTLLFAFPEGADDLAVVAGANSGASESFPLVLPN